MEAPFEEFLDQVDDLEIADQDDFNATSITGGEINDEDEEASVLRFRTMENSPPSLISLSIFKICSWINELTCNPSNNKLVQDFYNNRVKQLPIDTQARIRTQLSMTSLRCIYQHRVWELDPHIIAAGIKQEEDMLRYLLWKQPTSPLLKHFEKTQVIKLFEDTKSINLISSTRISMARELKQSLLAPYLHNCFNFKFVSKDQFIDNFTKLTNGCLKNLNWNNVLVVGGSVLKSLRREAATDFKDGSSNEPFAITDIDIYVYGLTPLQAQAKVEEVFNAIQSCWSHKIGIFKTARTITLVSNHEFRNVQIILSAYASPLEILLSSDLNSCSIAFNGQSVLTIPRFLFGSIYGANVLDSSMKLATKLQPARLKKYYDRGYNVVSPLYLRVHGHGSLNSEEKIARGVHPTTFQMIELMKLAKKTLMHMIEGKSYFYSASDQWHRGMYIKFRTMPFLRREEENLREIMSNTPDWIRRYYDHYQVLSWVGMRRGYNRYAEDYRTLAEMQHTYDNGLHISCVNIVDREHPELHYNPNNTNDIHKYVTEQCTFAPYNKSILQSFHLNFFVNKKQTVVNPYREMNTSLVRINYRIETIQLTFFNFTKFLKGDVKNISKPFKMFNMNWKLTLSWGSKDVSFVSLTKEYDEHDRDSFNNDNYRPTKFFANFFIKIKNNKTTQSNGNTEDNDGPKHLIFDGSQVFTYKRPDNMWLTYLRTCYLHGHVPAYDYDWNAANPTMRLQYEHDMQYIEHGNSHWEVTMQLIEPQFNVVTM